MSVGREAARASAATEAPVADAGHARKETLEQRIARDLGALAEMSAALAELARAEAGLTAVALRRVVRLELRRIVAVVVAWLFAVLALIQGARDVLGSPVAAYVALAVLHGAIALATWLARRRWRARVGFPRTRELLAGLVEPRSAAAGGSR